LVGDLDGARDKMLSEQAISAVAFCKAGIDHPEIRCVNWTRFSAKTFNSGAERVLGHMHIYG
jgi:hypothetical protein